MKINIIKGINHTTIIYFYRTWRYHSETVDTRPQHPFRKI